MKTWSSSDLKCRLVKGFEHFTQALINPQGAIEKAHREHLAVWKYLTLAVTPHHPCEVYINHEVKPSDQHTVETKCRTISSVCSKVWLALDPGFDTHADGSWLGKPKNGDFYSHLYKKSRILHQTIHTCITKKELPPQTTEEAFQKIFASQQELFHHYFGSQRVRSEGKSGVGQMAITLMPWLLVVCKLWMSWLE